MTDEPDITDPAGVVVKEHPDHNRCQLSFHPPDSNSLYIELGRDAALALRDQLDAWASVH